MRNDKGFTLIEILIAMAILSIIAAIAIPAYTGYIKTSRKTECQNEIASIKLAESEFFLDNNVYFAGNGVAALAVASGNIYTPSSTAAGTGNTPSECTYDVAITPTTFTITATPAVGGHLVGEPNIVYTGP